MAGLYADTQTGAGKEAYYHPNRYIFNRIAEGPIPFGAAVVLGTDPNMQVKAISGATGVFAGVAFHKNFTDTEGQYSTGEGCDVVRSGIVWVQADEAINIGDAVRVVHTAGTGLTVGHFATIAVAGKTALLSNVEFSSQTTGPGLVALNLSGAGYTPTADV